MFTILVIDDEEEIRILYQKEFESVGYKVVVAGTIETAKELFLRGDINLVVLDIKLATQDSGLDILRWIRERERTIPIIISSGYPSYRQDFITWLADEYLVKSSNLDELKSAVSMMLKSRTKRKPERKSK